MSTTNILFYSQLKIREHNEIEIVFLFISIINLF